MCRFAALDAGCATGSASLALVAGAGRAEDLSVPGDRLSAVPGGVAMTTTSELVSSYLDVTRVAVGSFLARYREPTLTAYTQDLRACLGWCQVYEREPLRVTRGELEMYVRHLESRGYAAATVARRFGTVATFYKYAVIDGLRCCAPYAMQSTGAQPARSCGPAPAGGWTAPGPPVR
jgi:Phage integrase, N-terminal SAM-like domain